MALTGYASVVLARAEQSVTSGSTVDLTSGVYNVLYVTNGSTVSALTVKLPSSPQDGQLFWIANNAAITTLTLTPTATGAPSGLSAGQGIELMYSATLPGWFVFQV